MTVFSTTCGFLYDLWVSIGLAAAANTHPSSTPARSAHRAAASRRFCESLVAAARSSRQPQRRVCTVCLGALPPALSLLTPGTVFTKIQLQFPDVDGH